MTALLKTYSEENQRFARYAKALSHPVRVMIIELLSSQSCCYSGDLANDLPIARSTLSQHLSELKDAGLIRGQINPPRIKYCLDPDSWKEFETLFQTIFHKNISFKTLEQ